MPEIIVPRLPYAPPLPGAVMDPSHPLARGLVGWWPLNGDCIDYSGRGSHGTPTNFNWDTTDGWRSGHHSQGRGLLFAKTDDFVRTKFVPSVNLKTSVTISAWAWLVTGGESSTVYSTLFGGYTLTGAVNRLYLRAESSGKLRFGGGDGNTITSAVVPLQSWIHVCATYNGATPFIYVNAVRRALTGNTMTPEYFDYKAPIGAQSTTSSTFTADSYMDGAIQDVRIYNRALSDSEVLTLYRTPYAMMRPTVHRFYSIPASVGAVGGIFESSIFGGVLVR